MYTVNLVFLLYTFLTIISMELSVSESTHHRTKRIANRPRKPKNRTNQATPLGGAVTAVPEDDFADYPAGYFVKPGVTDIPENYDYAERKFNKPHLVKGEWKEEYTNHVKKYETEKSKLDGISPISKIGPLSNVGPVGKVTHMQQVPSPLRTLVDDDLL